VFHRIAAPLEAATQDYRPAVLYLNGEYWGIHNLRTRLDADHFALLTGSSPESIDVLSESKAGIAVVDGQPTAAQEFLALLEEMERTDPATADFVELVESTIDVSSFYDHVLVGLFSGNWDWGINNVRWWRARDSDGVWHWTVYDLDHAGGRYDVSGVGPQVFNPTIDLSRNTFERQRTVGKLFSVLMEHNGYRDAFFERADMVLETAFAASRTTAVLDEAANAVAAEMPRHEHRWPLEVPHDWQSGVDDLRRFLIERPAVFEVQLDALAERW
jgi:hypothetical protein